MRNFTMGLLAGLLLGTTGSSIAAEVVGRTGYLMGWQVVSDAGEICTDPYVWPKLRQIECN